MSELQHDKNDLDWMFRPYLNTLTKTTYDGSKIEGELNYDIE